MPVLALFDQRQVKTCRQSGERTQRHVPVGTDADYSQLSRGTFMVRIRLSDSSSAEFNPPVGSTTSGVVAAQEAARGVLSDLQGTFKKSAKSRGHLGG